MVGVVEEVGAAVTTVKPGDRVTVNGSLLRPVLLLQARLGQQLYRLPWRLGTGLPHRWGQAEFVRVPYADQGLNKIPDGVSDRQALFVGDILATGFWATRISKIHPEDTVLIIGAGPTGICTLLCALLQSPKRIIVCEKDPQRLRFVQEHYPRC